ncbi:class I adenylate-forming enzyme family protein [Paraburkholderia fynbosensis]|uniref:Tyrocidine synthase 3 n=1 Tax=Paraburkholderia fynbosensis TaxID=1200993 RepID=A0A6J5G1J8_9BURK|nr:class I adenylate-forming enzyme family protein [Paraburkholderia fynbosensis]CAB3789352.1 Tyrocidine synthase 3 [Paraburkholderia fynbosensis]
MNNIGNLGALIAAACRQHQGALAIDAPSAAVTYEGLLDTATALAAALGKLGVDRNEPVHVRVSNQPHDFAGLLGVWLAGCVAVPIHRTSPEAVTARILDRTQARFAVDVPQAFSGEQDAIERIGANASAPAPRAQLDDAALIIFTSGSTGAPKGVVVTHQAFSAKLLSIDAMIHFRKTERTLLLLNITFSFGIWVSLLTLLGGGTLVLPQKFEPALLLAQLRERTIHRVGVVPTMLRALLAAVPTASRNAHAFACPDLRQILTGGEQLSEQLATQIETLFPNADLINIFGLTETSTCDFFQFPNYRRTKPTSLGLPSSHVEYRVVDETQTRVPPGTIGELQLRSPYLMRGYLDEPQLTAAAFVHTWFRTGDLAVTTADGDVQLMGRQKELIVRGGNKVTPMEIEQAITMFEGVGAAMAVGAPDDILGERIHALVVPCSGNVLDVGALRAFLCLKLEKYKVPDFFYEADALPVGRTGKADRRELRSMVATGTLVPLTRHVQ